MGIAQGVDCAGFPLPISQVNLPGGNPTMSTIAERLLNLDTRHEKLLDKLALLDRQVNDVLLDWAAIKEVQTESTTPLMLGN